MKLIAPDIDAAKLAKVKDQQAALFAVSEEFMGKTVTCLAAISWKYKVVETAQDEVANGYGKIIVAVEEKEEVVVQNEEN